MNGLALESSAATMQLILKDRGNLLLISAAQSGDWSAFCELSSRYYAQTFRNIYRITTNWHDAEDVLQESLIKAFKYLNGFEGKASHST
jgi:RNA polymerase sigma-70 factor, ECF subfamily